MSMNEMVKVYELSRECDFTDKDIKRSFERLCTPSNVSELIEGYHNNLSVVAHKLYEMLESLRDDYWVSSAVGKNIDALLAEARGEL